jgi:hypothetical protein
MRSDYRGEAIVECEKGNNIGTLNIRNISLNGIYLESNNDFKNCIHCKLTIRLGDGSIEMPIDGEIIRKDVDGVAIRFSSMSPTTFDHLRKVVMYNSSSPEDFLKECKERPGFK